jgi:hypothetical protein
MNWSDNFKSFLECCLQPDPAKRSSPKEVCVRVCMTVCNYVCVFLCLFVCVSLRLCSKQHEHVCVCVCV